MPENRDHVYDPDPGKGFTRAKLSQLQEINKSQLETEHKISFIPIP